MLFSEYAAFIQDVITECSKTGLLVASELTADSRTAQIGLLKGMLAFVDGSTLFFKEYLDLRRDVCQEMYSFHYQDAQAALLFRYDNAAHKPDLGFQDHKHTPEKIAASSKPDLPKVLDEIVNSYLYYL